MITVGKRVLHQMTIALSAIVSTFTPVAGQPAFSITYRGPTKGAADSCTPGLSTIAEGEILFPPPPTGTPAPGPLPPPCILTPVTDLGLPAPTSLVAGVPGLVEVDAVSYGDDQFQCSKVYFSVDPYATGFSEGFPPPTVFSEGAVGNLEAAADVYWRLFFSPSSFPAPLCPAGDPATVITTGGSTDGDGFFPWGPAGVGLVEPNPPGVPPIPPATPGDDLDAVDVDPPAILYPVYLSLDSSFVDPLTGLANTGSASANGFDGGDVLVKSSSSAALVVYAPAAALGLDLAGPDTDDVDAIAIWENGDGIYTASSAPNDWAFSPPDTPGAPDMLLFSVRRGSSVIGVIDSWCGEPIEEGDVLTTPVGSAATPAIYLAAESLGLATFRSGTADVFGDELDALDIVHGEVTLPDCQPNGIHDAFDIASGNSSDCNSDGVPDECQSPSFAPGTSFYVGLSPRTLDAATINGSDANIDLAVGLYDENTVKTFLNSGTASFTLSGPPISVSTGPASLVLSDLNGGGGPDVAVVCTANSLMTLLNDGLGGFPGSASYSTLDVPNCVIAADINGDGNPDLAYTHAVSGSTCVRLNDGSGLLLAPSCYVIDPDRVPLSLASADFDGDGDVDLAVAHQNEPFIKIWINNGAGLFGFGSQYPILGVSIGPKSIAAADLDSDGDVDLAAVNQNSDSLTILANSGPAAFVIPPASIAVGDGPSSITIAQISPGCGPELIITHLNSDDVAVLQNLGGSFAAPVAFPVELDPVAAAARDFDGDGDIDLAVANRASNSVSILLNTSLGTPFLLGDTDGDGDVDGTDIAGFLVCISSGVPIEACAPADLDDDGDIDADDVLLFVDLLLA